MEDLALLVESRGLWLKALVATADAEPAESAVALTQRTLKLSFYDVTSSRMFHPMALCHRLHEAGAWR